MGTESDGQQVEQAPPQGEAAGGAAGESSDVAAYRAWLAAQSESTEIGGVDDGSVTITGRVEAPGLPDWAPPVGDIPEPDPMDALRTLTDEERWAAADAPARSPDDYRMPGVHQSHGDDIGPELLAEGHGVRALLFAANVPAVEGEGLLHDIAQLARTSEGPPSDEAFELQMQQTHAQLRRVMGDSEFERCQAALSKLKEDVLAKLPASKREALEDYLETNAHLLASPVVLHRLLHHAGRGRRR